MTAPLFTTGNGCRALMDLHPALRERPEPDEHGRTGAPPRHLPPRPALVGSAVLGCLLLVVTVLGVVGA